MVSDIAPLLNQLPDRAHAEDVILSILVPATHMRHVESVPDSWLRFVPGLAVVSIWELNYLMKISVSALQNKLIQVVGVFTI